MAASSVPELRRRVEHAAAVLDDVGNIRELARLLSSAAYAAVCMCDEREAWHLAVRAMPITHELDDAFLSMILQGNFGLAALLVGETDLARDAFREELHIARELVVEPVAAEGLIGFAAISALRGDDDRAAQLLGAAQAQEKGGGEQPDVDDILEIRFFHQARARYGADRWDAMVHHGAALSFAQAIDYAVSDSPAQPSDHSGRPPE
jgi:hypothetical protein